MSKVLTLLKIPQNKSIKNVQRNLSEFSKRISQIRNINLKHFRVLQIKFFGPFDTQITYFSQCSRSQCGEGGHQGGGHRMGGGGKYKRCGWGEGAQNCRGGYRETHIYFNYYKFQLFCLLKKSVRFKAIEVCGLKQFAIK